MLLKNLAHQAVLQGHTGRFTLASDMLHDLAAQDSSVALARRLRRYTTPTILAIDEVGYLSYDALLQPRQHGVSICRKSQYPWGFPVIHGYEPILIGLSEAPLQI
jgi:IstB-like ATP binding protein